MTAREFIESIIEIHRKHGMSSAPEPVIEAAIRDVEQITKRLKKLNHRQTPTAPIQDEVDGIDRLHQVSSRSG